MYTSVYHPFLGGAARGRVIPSSIPNLEVKPPIADNTAGYVCGNVGQCHLETNLTSFILYYNQSLSILFLILITFYFTIMLICYVLFDEIEPTLFCFTVLLVLLSNRKYKFMLKYIQ